MQVDHVVPVNGYLERGEDTLDNMLPACRSCNHYKSKSTLEGFRRKVENMPNVLMRDSVTYRNAVRFGLVRPTPHPVRFYFEQLSGGRASPSDYDHSTVLGRPGSGMFNDNMA